MKYLVTVRGTLKSDVTNAMRVHNEIIEKLSPMTQSMGGTGHHPHLGLQTGTDFLSLDYWDNLENMQKLYSDPQLGTEFARMFEGQPEVSIWMAPDGWATF